MLGKIYKLECEDGHYYIGSTKQLLCQRLSSHKRYSINDERILYNHIRSIGWDKVKMILIKEIEIISLYDLKIIENNYINLNDELCLNTYPSIKEKNYTVNHKEHKKQYDKEYREKNKEQIKLKEKERYYKKKSLIR